MKHEENKLFHLSVRHSAVAVPYTPAVVNLFPHGKKVTVQGKELVALPHGIDETRMLRNLGIQVPAPVLSQYDWAAKEGGVHEPFEIQRRTVAMLTLNTRAYVLNGMGTGKTRAALWAWDYLNKQGLTGKLLVVAPLSTLNFTWMREIFHTLPHRKAVVLHGTRDKRHTTLASEDTDIYIINHDGLNVVMASLKSRTDVDTLVLDELAVYRNGTASRTKTIREYAKQMKWVWGMTGSPTPNSPTDAWAQASIITPHTVPKYFNRFRDELMEKRGPFKFVPKPDAVEKAYAALQPAVRYTLDDIIELPDLVERTLDIEMGVNQKKVYTHMKNSAYAAIASKEITAMNAGAVLQKLLQISTGWVYTRGGETVALDNDNRLDALVDALESTERKVIVFVPFVHALQGITKRLQDEQIDVATISGATPKATRDDVFRAFQNSNRIRVLVAHPQCMAHGITLTAADTIIWFAPTASLEIFEQANARIRRVGQKHKQLILMLQATEVERKAYARLRAKQKVQNLLLSMFEEGS
jgi:SNF2 family DNA or RNA helicase